MVLPGSPVRITNDAWQCPRPIYQEKDLFCLMLQQAALNILAMRPFRISNLREKISALPPGIRACLVPFAFVGVFLLIPLGLALLCLLLMTSRAFGWVFVGLILFRFWPSIVPTVSDYLHIPSVVAVLVLAAALSTCVFSTRHYQLNWRFNVTVPLYRWGQNSCLCIDLIGGLLPIALALYQLTRVPLLAVLAVGIVATALNYFTAYPIKGLGVFTHTPISCLTALVCTLVAGLIVPASPERLDVAVAFAGSVVGSVVGSDLLHINHIRIDKLPAYAIPDFPEGDFVIGGDGGRDGILRSSLLTLFTTAWLPDIPEGVSEIFSLPISATALTWILVAVVSLSALLLKTFFGPLDPNLARQALPR